MRRALGPPPLLARATIASSARVALFLLLCAVLFAVSLGSAWGRVMAQALPTVRVDTTACPGVDARRVEELLAIELDTTVERRGGVEGVVGVALSCSGEGVEISVDDPVTRKNLRRQLELSSRAEAVRPRVLALAAAELVIASWVELELAPREAEDGAAEIDVPQVPVVPALRAAIRARVTARRMSPADRENADPLRLRVGAVARLLGFLPEGDALYGGGAALGVELGAWSFGLELAWLHGERAFAEGDALSDLASARADAALTWSMGWLALRSFAGVRVGSAFVRGRSGDAQRAPNEITGVFFGPCGGVEVALRPGPRWRVGLGFELGAAMTGVEGQIASARAVAISGGWLSGSLSLAFVGE